MDRLSSAVFNFFFFSSRRRHTRCSRDWSSDVCSSDLTRLTCFCRGRVSSAPQTRRSRIRHAIACRPHAGLDHCHARSARKSRCKGRSSPLHCARHHGFLGGSRGEKSPGARRLLPLVRPSRQGRSRGNHRSEEHTSELQSRLHLVCRLLLEKKKKTTRKSSDSITD